MADLVSLLLLIFRASPSSHYSNALMPENVRTQPTQWSQIASQKLQPHVLLLMP